MKHFLFKLSLFAILLLVILTFIMVRYGGYIDYFYLKFTSPKQSSFVLGDSRSFQGIQPKIIDDYFKNGPFELPMFNYSFTIAQVSYGELYTQSVKDKMILSTKKGLFILSVNPWLLAKRKKDDFKKKIFMESENPPYNMNFLSMNPNFEYFIKNFNNFHFKGIFRRNSRLHKDGWMEEGNLPKDLKTLTEWQQHQINIYMRMSTIWKKDSYRINELEKLIVYLKKHGTVFLVRMPIDEKLLAIEDRFWKEFDDDIKVVANRNCLSYINFSKNIKYKTYDGNHIDKYGGKIFTNDLCDSIKKSFVQNKFIFK